jgi:hypothetical protein
MEEIYKQHYGLGALIHTEILSQIDMVVNGERPINPCFLYDLGVLTEAICLSDCYTWYFKAEKSETQVEESSSHNAVQKAEELLTNRFGIHESLGGPVSTALISSECVKAYSGGEIDAFAQRDNLNFDYYQFLLDQLNSRMPFNYFVIDEDFPNFLNLHTYAALLYRKNPYFNFLRILQRINVTVIEGNELGETNSMEGFLAFTSDRKNADAASDLPDRFGFSDIKLRDFIYDVIEAQELQANSTYNLASFFHLEDIHLPLLGRPLQIQQEYKQAFDCISKIINDAKAEIGKIEDKFNFRSGYSLLPVPHFARILLANCRSREDIPRQLIEMRERYGPLRKTMAKYRQRIQSAESISELQRIDHELNTAWINLLKKEEKDLSSRLVYRIWEVVKTGPKMLIEYLDKLRIKDELEYPIFRVRGLYDLWSDLKGMPPQWQLLSLVENVFSESIREIDHQAFIEYCEALEPLSTNRHDNKDDPINAVPTTNLPY